MHGIFPICIGFRCGDSPDNFGGIAKGKGVVRNMHLASDKRAGADNAVAANHGAAQDDAAHANDRVVPDGTSMNNGIVSDGDANADLNGEICVCVQGGIVLYVAVVPDRDGIGVTADNSIVPNSYIFSEIHLSDNLCASGNQAVFGHNSPPFAFASNHVIIHASCVLHV